jgi:CheY-like chemotaxis protein
VTDRPRRLLVLDDAPQIRALFRTALRLDHPEVELREAASAEEALDICTSWPPDAIVVDAILPGADGVEFVRRARRLCPDAVMVMFSSVPHSDLADPARDAGADQFLEKSQGYEAVLDALGLAR